MSDNAREIAERLAAYVYSEPGEFQSPFMRQVPTVHDGYWLDREQPVNNMFHESELSSERAAMEFVIHSGKYRVLVYKVEE